MHAPGKSTLVITIGLSLALVFPCERIDYIELQSLLFLEVTLSPKTLKVVHIAILTFL